MADLKETITDLFVQLNPHNQNGFLQKMRDFDVYSKIDLSEDEFVSVTNRKKLKLKITKLFSQLNPKHQQDFLDQMQAISMASSVSSVVPIASLSSSSNKKRPAHQLKIAPKRQRLNVNGAKKMTGGGKIQGFGDSSDSDSDSEKESDNADANADADADEEDEEERMQRLLNVGEIVTVNYYEDETNTIFDDDIIFDNLCKVLSGESPMFQGRGQNGKLQRFVMNLIQLKNDTQTHQGRIIDDDIKPILRADKKLIDVKWIVPLSAQKPLTTQQELSEQTIAKRLVDVDARAPFGGDPYFFKEMFLEYGESKLTKSIVDNGSKIPIGSFLVAPSYFTSAAGNAAAADRLRPKEDFSTLIPTLQGMLLREPILRNFLQKSFGLGVSGLKTLANQRLLFKDYEVTAAQKDAFLTLLNVADTAKRLREAVKKDEAEADAAAVAKQAEEAANAAKQVKKITVPDLKPELHEKFINMKQKKLDALKKLATADINPFGSLATAEHGLLEDFFENYKSSHEKLYEDLSGALEVFKGERQLESGDVFLTRPQSTIVVSKGSSVLYVKKTRFESLQDKLEAILSMPIVNLEQLDQFLQKHTYQDGQWYKERVSRQNILCEHRHNQVHSFSNTLLFEYVADVKMCRVCKENVGGADLQFASIAFDDDGAPKDFFGVKGIVANGTTNLGAETPIFVRGTQLDTWAMETSSLQMSAYKDRPEMSDEYKLEMALNKLLNKNTELVRYKKWFLSDQPAKKEFIDQCLDQGVGVGAPAAPAAIIQLIKQTQLPPGFSSSRSSETCVVPKDESQILKIEQKQQTQYTPPTRRQSLAYGGIEIEQLLLKTLNIRALPDQYKKVMALPRIAAEFHWHYTKQPSKMFDDILSFSEFQQDLGVKYRTTQQSFQLKKTVPADLPLLSQRKTLNDYAKDENVKKTLLVLFVHNMAKKMVAENKSMKLSEEFDQCSKDAVEQGEQGDAVEQGDDADGGSTRDDDADMGDDGNADEENIDNDD